MNIEHVYLEGYRVVDGSVVSPKGNVLSTSTNSDGYVCFSCTAMGKRSLAKLHRLLAFQLFGAELLRPGIVVRHLDGDPSNNDPGNIGIGTQQQNMMDKPKHVRLRAARVAAAAQRKLTASQAEELRADRASGAKYAQLVEKYGISKTGVSYIVNHKTY